MILLRHTVLRSLTRYERHFRRPMHPAATHMRLLGNYCWASVSTTPILDGDTFLDACFHLLRVFAEHDSGPYPAPVRPFDVDDSWRRACAELTSKKWEFRPMKVNEFARRATMPLFKDAHIGLAPLHDARVDEAIMIDPSWNSLFYAGRVRSTAALYAWATNA